MLVTEGRGTVSAPLAVCLLILAAAPYIAGARKPAPIDGGNAIYVEVVKTYDEGAVEQLLASAQQSLSNLTGFSQSSLQFGQIQGAVANQTALSANLTGPGGAAPSTPSTTSPSSFNLPNLTPSAVDLLNEQMQAQLQIINMQLLLRGSLNDQSPQDPLGLHQRYRTTLGFPIYITVPPGFKYQEAVAEVEITICAPPTIDSPDNKPADATLVTLLPQEKTYNVASLVSSAASIGTGVVAGVVTGSAGFLRSRQTYYLVQDQDTLALQRPSHGTCASGAIPLTFAWQFRPVLGQKVVRDGLRQTFAQISLPAFPNSTKVCALPVIVRSGWPHYHRTTPRVGPMIERSAEALLAAQSVHDFPAPTFVSAYDNGDGTVTMIASGGFKAGTRVRVGNTILGQNPPAQGGATGAFEQNDKYIRFSTTALSLITAGASLVNNDGMEAPAKFPYDSGYALDYNPPACVANPSDITLPNPTYLGDGQSTQLTFKAHAEHFVAGVVCSNCRVP